MIKAPGPAEFGAGWRAGISELRNSAQSGLSTGRDAQSVLCMAYVVLRSGVIQPVKMRRYKGADVVIEADTAAEHPAVSETKSCDIWNSVPHDVRHGANPARTVSALELFIIMIVNARRHVVLLHLVIVAICDFSSKRECITQKKPHLSKHSIANHGTIPLLHLLFALTIYLN